MAFSNIMKKIVFLSILPTIILFPLEDINLASAIKDNDFDETRSSTRIDFNNTSNLVYDRDSNPYNISYSDWTAKWWQWTYSILLDRHSSYDDTGKLCGENQKNPVWYLSNSWIFCCPNM